MPVSITCRNTEINEELADLVTKKTRKLKKFFDKVDKIDVVFTAEKFRRKCEITVHAAPFQFAAHAENGDEQCSFDKALKSISRQIRDSKQKMIQRKRKTALEPTATASDETVEEETA